MYWSMSLEQALKMNEGGGSTRQNKLGENLQKTGQHRLNIDMENIQHVNQKLFFKRKKYSPSLETT